MHSDFRQDARPDPAETPLECRIEDVSGCTVIHVSGEVDLVSGHILKMALNSAIATRRPIIVDFSATRYIDSTGIQVLLNAKERHQQTLAVAALASIPKRILEIAKIQEVIPLYATLAAAMSTVCTQDAAKGVPRS